MMGSKRYLLLLPVNFPPQTSVLMTVGMAVALKIPCAIFAEKDAKIPYLVEGAIASKDVTARLTRYADINDIEKCVENNGLHLFG